MADRDGFDGAEPAQAPGAEEMDSNGYPGDSAESHGYRGDSHGYPVPETPTADGRTRAWDPQLHLDPDEARRHFPPHGVPVAGPGLAGYAIERDTGKAVYVGGGEVQLDVLCEPVIGYSLQSERAAERAAVLAADAAQEAPHGDPGQVARDGLIARRRRRPWQVNVRLDDDEFRLLDAASRRCRIPRATLARLLLLRGAEAILADQGD